MGLFDSEMKPSIDLAEIKRYLSKAELIACDIETTGFDRTEDVITIISFACENDKGEVIGWAIETRDFTVEEIFKEFYDILHDKSKSIIFHNASFDVKFLNYNNFFLSTKIVDTMVMLWLMDEDRRRAGHPGFGLKPNVLKFLNYRMSSYDEARSIFGAFEEYAADDAVQALKLFRYLESKLRDIDLLDWFWGTEVPITKILIEVENRGVSLNKTQLKRIKREAWEFLEALEKDIHKFVGYKFDVGSPKQLAKVLFEELRIGMRPDGTNEFSTKGKSKEFSTANAVMVAIARSGYECKKPDHKKCGHKLVGKLLKFREMNTRQNTFIKPLLERCRINPIIHPRFIQTGTVTGRFASKDPNYQNLPRKGGVRKAFVARTKHKIVKADYCVSGDTRIETSRGTLAITDVIPGDEVIIEDGSSKEVLKVIDRGLLPIVELETEHGYKLKATKMHRIRVIDKHGDYIWRRIGKLEDSDRVAIQPGCGKGSLQKLPKIVFTHPNNTKFKTPEFLTEDIALFLGYLCGDGCSNLHKANVGSSYIGSVHGMQDPDFIDWAREAFKRIFEGCHLQESKCKNKEAYNFRITSKPLLLWCRKIGISKETVPELIKRSPPRMVKAFLRGFFETDGSIGEKSNGQRISASSSRKSLLEEMQLLLLKVGIPSTIRLVTYTLKNEKKYDGWHICIPTTYANKFAKEIGFLSERKTNQLNAYLSTCNKCPSIGGYPNQKQKVKNLRTSKQTRRLLNNTSSLGRDISRKLALQMKDEDEEVYKELHLYRVAEYNTLFEKVKSITEKGIERVYDLSVPGPMTYISNGFVSHNSQAELRVMAHMSGDPVMLSLYRAGKDIHQSTADACGVTRKAAKAINFGLIYRMSAARLQAQLAIEGIEISIKDAYKYVNSYFRNFRRVKEYHKRVESVVMHRLDQNGDYSWIKTLGGRYRRLDRDYLLNRETAYTAITQAINTTIQGGVSDLIKVAMVDIQSAFRERGWIDPESNIWKACIQGQVHDEIFAECEESIAEEVAYIITDSMVNAGIKYKIRVPMSADTAIVNSLAK